jgi:DnaK suppressor protein
MSDIDLEAFRALLQERRAELESVAQSSAAAAETVELDQTRVGRLSRMDALQGQAMAKESERRRRAEVTRIDAALVRISADDYGYCVDCGEDVPTQRLHVDPATTLCLKCAETRES